MRKGGREILAGGKVRCDGSGVSFLDHVWSAFRHGKALDEIALFLSPKEQVWPLKVIFGDGRENTTLIVHSYFKGLVALAINRFFRGCRCS